MKNINTDLCVIGGGSGGLSVASGASQMGADVILIEKSKMGGDCLNYGCIPSKSLLSPAHLIEKLKNSEEMGINNERINCDFKKVNEHVDKIINKIAPNDSQQRFSELGVKVIRGEASFTGKREIEVNGTRVSAKYFVIAAGSKPVSPPIEGIEEIDYLTNETIFNLQELPEHLIVVGGGPIGSELSQAFRILGSRVSVIQRGKILPKDDPLLTKTVSDKFKEDGIELYENSTVKSVQKYEEKLKVSLEQSGEVITLEGSHLLIAAERAPDLKGLNLEKAGIKYTKKGIEVNNRLQTSDRKIFAIGDCIKGYKFTHLASYQAGIVIRNILFKLPAKVNYSALPWVTYTAPELAHVGMNEEKAVKKYSDAKTVSMPLSENDRYQCESETNGMIKVVSRKNGKILGVSIVGENAGELIPPWCLAITSGMKLKDIAGTIFPYPTRSEISKQAAGKFYTPMLYSQKTKKFVRFLMKWF